MKTIPFCLLFVFCRGTMAASIYGPNIKCYGDSVAFNVNGEHEFLTNATKVTVRHQDATTTKCSVPLSHPFTDPIKFNFDACKLTRTAITGPEGPMGFSLDVPVIIINDAKTISFKLGCTYDATMKFTASLGVGEPAAQMMSENLENNGTADTGKGVTPGLTGFFLDKIGNIRDPEGPAIELGGTVNFQLAINDTFQTFILPRDCYFSDKEKGGTQVAFVSHGCPKSNPLIGGQIKKASAHVYDISFSAFRIGDSKRLYIFCEIELCISKEKCHKDCWGPVPTDPSMPGMETEVNSTEITIDHSAISGGTTAATVRLSTVALGRRRRREANEDEQLDKLINYITIIDPFAKERASVNLLLMVSIVALVTIFSGAILIGYMMVRRANANCSNTLVDVYSVKK